MKYRKKPVVVEAFRWDGENWEEIEKWSGGAVYVRGRSLPLKERIMQTQTLEGQMECPVFWWVIKGVKNEFYFCRPDIFEMTYEKVEL